MEEKKIIEGVFSKFNLFSGICIYFAIGEFIASIVITASANESGTEYAYLLGIAALLIFGGLAYYFYRALNKCEITVTDKRVYGKAIFNKRVDLPFDMISSVAMGAFNSVSVSTASGNIKFFGIKNKDSIFNAITDILLKRQNKETKTETIIKQETSNADELKKYKDLLDSGIITQEEFDAKKKQLLGL